MSRLLVSFWRAQTTARLLTVCGMLMMRRGQAGACRRSFGASLPLSAGPIVTTTSFFMFCQRRSNFLANACRRISRRSLARPRSRFGSRKGHSDAYRHPWRGSNALASDFQVLVNVLPCQHLASSLDLNCSGSAGSNIADSFANLLHEPPTVPGPQVCNEFAAYCVGRMTVGPGIQAPLVSAQDKFHASTAKRYCRPCLLPKRTMRSS